MAVMPTSCCGAASEIVSFKCASTLVAFCSASALWNSCSSSAGIGPVTSPYLQPDLQWRRQICSFLKQTSSH